MAKKKEWQQTLSCLDNDAFEREHANFSLSIFRFGRLGQGSITNWRFGSPLFITVAYYTASPANIFDESGQWLLKFKNTHGANGRLGTVLVDIIFLVFFFYCFTLFPFEDFFMRQHPYRDIGALRELRWAFFFLFYYSQTHILESWGLSSLSFLLFLIILSGYTLILCIVLERCVAMAAPEMVA